MDERFREAILYLGGAAIIEVIRDSIFTNLNMQFVMGYTAYFICGYYINKTDISVFLRRILYLLGIVGAIGTVVLEYSISNKMSIPYERYYDHHSVNVMVEAIALFVWLKYNIGQHKCLDSFVTKLGRYCFGIYLVHVFVWSIIQEVGIYVDSFNPILSIPILSVVVFAVSFVISFVLNHIPWVNKYLV